ncbi:MAG: glycosyltransferase family 2 protein [Halobacteriota archaeon]
MTKSTPDSSSDGTLHQFAPGVRRSDSISVVIPTKNRPLDVLECIRSVENQSILPAEIIIVDASDDDRLEALACKRSIGRIKIEYVRSEPGLTHQKNMGVQKSSSDIVLVLDDDVILNENFVEEILNVFNDPRLDGIGCVYGDQIPINKLKKNASKRGSFPYAIASAVDARINKLVSTVFFLQKTSKTGKFRLSGFSTLPPYSNPEATIQETEGAPGGYTAYYKKVLEEFGFDENLKGYAAGEDADISYRISRKYKIIFTPKAKVIHDSKTSKINNYAHSKMKIENHYYLFKKNFPQTLIRRFAFNMSVLGLFLLQLEFAVVHRNPQGVRGFLDGLRAAHKNSRSN